MLSTLSFLLLAYATVVKTEKCYSCSSPHLAMRWPKDEETNQLLYLSEFPYFANESCDQVKNAIPVVDCPNSVCIKAVIKEPPAKRDVCIQGGAVVRDCWSRVMGNVDKQFSLDPKARKSMLRLAEDIDSDRTIGVIYTCEGFLCNAVPSLSMILSVYILLISLFMI